MSKGRQRAINIQQDLAATHLTIKEIATKYAATPATVRNINKGLTYYNPALSYPIRQEQITQTDSIVPFIQRYAAQYNRRQLAIITELSIDTIDRILKQEKVVAYQENKELEDRRKIFDVLRRPMIELIRPLSPVLEIPVHTVIEIEDLIYLKWLAYCGADLAESIWIFRNYIWNDGYRDYPLTLEDLQKYLRWNGTSSYMISYLKKVYQNIFKTTEVDNLTRVTYSYREMDMRRFGHLLTPPQIQIAFEMRDFIVKDSFYYNNQYLYNEN